MGYIDLKVVQAVGERLLEQISILQNLREELRQTKKRIKDMAYMEEALYLLRKSEREIEEEIQSLQNFVQCLESVSNIYRTTEDRIADVYNLEQIVYPKTEFRTSRISGLDGYEHLLEFLTVT